MFFNNGGRRIFTVLISGVYVWRSALIYGANLRRLRMALIQKALLRHNLQGWFRARRWCFIVGMCPELAGLVSRSSMVLYCWDVIC